MAYYLENLLKIYKITYVTSLGKTSRPYEFTNPRVVELSSSISQPHMVCLLFHKKHAPVMSIFILSLKLQSCQWQSVNSNSRATYAVITDLFLSCKQCSVSYFLSTQLSG